MSSHCCDTSPLHPGKVNLFYTRISFHWHAIKACMEFVQQGNFLLGKHDVNVTDYKHNPMIMTVFLQILQLGQLLIPPPTFGQVFPA